MYDLTKKPFQKIILKKGHNNKMTYVWPAKETFSSAFACRTLPVYGSASFKLLSGIEEPIYNLFPNFGKLSVFVFSWALLVGCFLLVYYVLPIWHWNSVDGQYVDTTRSLIVSSVLYIILASFIVSKLN
jgi:hypothetical protein